MSLSVDENELKRLLEEGFETLQVLRESNTSLSEIQPVDFRVCLDQVANVADELGLLLLSTTATLMDRSAEQLVDNGALNSDAVESMLAWVNQARMYVDSSTDAKTIAALIETVDPEHHDELRSMFLLEVNHTNKQDKLTEQQQQDVGVDFGSLDTESEDTDAWNDNFEIDDILGLKDPFDGDASLLETLSNELNLLQPQFDSLVELVEKKSPKKVLRQAADEIAEGFERLQAASEDVELGGLALLAEFFKTNLSNFSGLPVKRKRIVTGLLTNFPAVFAAHLKEPAEDSWCLEILNTVTHTAWENPVTYREESTLINALLDQLEVSGEQLRVVGPDFITSEEMSLEISEDASPGLIDSFFIETPKDAETLAAEIAAISKGNNLHEHLRRAQRISHTLKGSANLIGVRAIANIAHNLETIFEHLLLNDVQPSPRLAGIMQESADSIEIMIENLQEGTADSGFAASIMQSLLEEANELSGPMQHTSLTLEHEEPELEQSKQQLDSAELVDTNLELVLHEDSGLSDNQASVKESEDVQYAISDDPGSTAENLMQEQKDGEHFKHPMFVRKRSNTATPFDKTRQALQKVLDEHQYATEQVSSTEEVQTSTQAQDVLRVPKELIDDVINMVGETSIAYGQIVESLKGISENTVELKQHDRIQQMRRHDLENLVNVQGMAKAQSSPLRIVNASAQHDDSFDSLEMDEYNEMYAATHGYIESVADSMLISREMSENSTTLESLIVQQQRLNSSLQDIMMSMRMVPASNLTGRLQRTVRQASRMTHKEAELTIVGGNMMIDSDALNSLADPLMHLLRNAVDHGIEPADERFNKGKVQAGQISVAFAQLGNDIIIRCKDDGYGLDHDKILSKAFAAGLTDRQQMENDAIARLILLPGFSTRSDATQVSGRGVGMDVVNNVVTKLRGNISISSELGLGTEITLRIPLTLLTSHSLLVKSGERLFAIPTNSLEQIFTPDAGKVERVGNILTYRNERNSYAAKSLDVLLGLSASTHQESLTTTTQKPMLLTRVDNVVTAVMVDEVVSTVDLVVKGCGHYVRDIEGIIGVSILGNGQVVPVVDVPELVRHDSTGIARIQRKAIAQAKRIPSVLIVDDSISVRNSFAEIISDAGFKPLLARDGLEAIKILNKNAPDIIFTDLEMPHMNGIDMTSNIRALSGFADLPIVMITSRTMQKHQDQAMAAGVTQYITKPVVPEDLVDIVNQQLTAST